MRRTALVLAVAVVLLAGCGWARPRFDDAKTGHISLADLNGTVRVFVLP
jgi:hypothetical protein